VLIETSTLSVADKLDLGERARERGATLLDCPVSGTSEQAQSRDLIAYVSGDPEAKARALPVIAAFTRGQFDVGRLGDGTKVKLVANLLVAIHNVAAAEALALARGAGLDLTATLAAVADGAGSSRMLQVRGPRMIEEDYLPATMRVSLFQKDIHLIRDLQASLGLQAPLLEAAAGVYAEAEDLGFGDLDTASVFTVLKPQVPPQDSV
jgi:3-hydroxyisobutyrate dehydrogenase-like beta-hydroxyacid dehydrogenase